MKIITDIPIDAHYHTITKNVSKTDIDIILEAIRKSTPIPEVDENMTNDKKINGLNDAISKIRDLFDVAFEYNKYDESRTELSQKCTTYLVGVWQTLAALRDELIED